MNTALDLRSIKLPTKLMVDGHDLAPALLEFVDATVAAWTPKYLSHRQGYGLTSTNVVPVGTLMSVDWDDPRALLGYGIAAHGASPHYPWNALRKKRMLARARQTDSEFVSSLQIATSYPSFPRDVITDDEREEEKTGGLIRWGDFPYGGVVYRSDGINEVMLGFSVWTQREDHRVAGATADRLLELVAALAA
jgi:hypothetical protein